MNVDPVCPARLEAEETIGHVFNSCQFARLILAISGLPVLPNVACFTDIL